ncbi:hypothetical protein GCM10010274_57210 [Streptomyces lavendofoliae]|uniref:Uncharacterized protein n=1 Tax=Streptomyces lavendofoliae TaxID=67314 RepID=A0A918M7R2_9ACTN|nr:hypothetical protein GCM10010274_57210 [Streptomyces lavendofoliae]
MVDRVPQAAAVPGVGGRDGGQDLERGGSDVAGGVQHQHDEGESADQDGGFDPVGGLVPAWLSRSKKFGLC